MTGPASEATAYPVLDKSQQARLRRYGTTHRVTAGEILYSPADDSSDLLVVLSGEVVVSNESQGRSVEYARHGPGEFAGELNLLTGQRPFLTARATTDGWVLALTPARLREVLARETDIADILLRALIARRRRHVSGVTPGARAPPADSRDPRSPSLLRPRHGSYCMVASVMQLWRHGWGNHAVSAWYVWCRRGSGASPRPVRRSQRQHAKRHRPQTA